VCLERRGPQGLGTRDDTLAVDLQHKSSGGGLRERDLVLVEGIDVGCRGGDELLGLPLAQDSPTATVDGLFGLFVGATDGLGTARRRRPSQCRPTGSDRSASAGYTMVWRLPRQAHRVTVTVPNTKVSKREWPVSWCGRTCPSAPRTTVLSVCRTCSRFRFSRRSRWPRNSSRSSSRPRRPTRSGQRAFQAVEGPCRGGADRWQRRGRRVPPALLSTSFGFVGTSGVGEKSLHRSASSPIPRPVSAGLGPIRGTICLACMGPPTRPRSPPRCPDTRPAGRPS
jgi:hypothetical protein